MHSTFTLCYSIFFLSSPMVSWASGWSQAGYVGGYNGVCTYFKGSKATAVNGIYFAGSHSTKLSSVGAVLSEPVFDSLSDSAVFRTLSFRFVQVTAGSFFLGAVGKFYSRTSGASSSLFLLRASGVVPSLLGTSDTS